MVVQKTTKPKTLGPPIPDSHKFQALKCTMWDGAWTLYYLSCCSLLDVMANGKESLGKADVATAADEYCKCLSNMAQVCLSLHSRLYKTAVMLSVRKDLVHKSGRWHGPCVLSLLFYMALLIESMFSASCKRWHACS